MANPIGLCDAAEQSAAFWLILKKLDEAIGLTPKKNNFYQAIVKDTEVSKQEFTKGPEGGRSHYTDQQQEAKNQAWKHLISFKLSSQKDVLFPTAHITSLNAIEFRQAILKSNHCAEVKTEEQPKEEKPKPKNPSQKEPLKKPEVPEPPKNDKDKETPFLPTKQ